MQTRFRLTLLSGLLLASLPALSDTPGEPMIEIGLASAEAEARMSWGMCPCLRWTVGVEVMGGKVETRDFLISTEALFRMNETRALDYVNDLTSRLYTVGALEALWSGGIGVKFDGVTVGNDIDRSYSDIARTGLQLMLNLVRTEAVRLDIRSGYEMERFRVMLGDETELRTLPQSLFVEWNAGRFSGMTSATVALNTDDLFEPDLLRLRGETRVDWNFLKLDYLLFHLGLRASYEHDPIRKSFGLAPTNATGGLFMKMSWVPVRTALRDPRDFTQYSGGTEK